jgi:Fe-Mn family superoxide dismutase
MNFHLKPLPYAKNALEPYLSIETLTLHHDKHHAAYLHKLESLIGGKPEAKESLESIVKSANGVVFNNAAQVWNHDFLWRSLMPNAQKDPSGALADALDDAFGTVADFREAFLKAGEQHFGSGWVWLVEDCGRLRITTTENADLPLRYGQNPILTADLWEHAYYIDYRNERERYLEVFVDHLVNWPFAAANWSAVRAR